MRLLRIMLPLLALLIGSVAATADYNPTDPPEPGIEFLLTARCEPANAAYSITSPDYHAYGSSVYVSVSANTGFRFVRWEDEDGNEVSAEHSFYYTMPARNVTLIARMEYDPSSPSEPSTPDIKSYSTIDFAISPSGAGHFQDNYAGRYEVGSTQQFRVYANTNYRFVNWTRDGIEVGTSTTFEYTVPSSNHTLVANFVYEPTSPDEPGVPQLYRRLTLKSNPPRGASSLSGAGEYLEGSSQRVYCSANNYYSFVNWTDDLGEVVSEERDFDYTMPNRNATLTANFTNNYNPANPDEPGTPDPGGSVGENMVTRPRFSMYDDTHVEIFCDTPYAEIHYTLDGSVPTSASPKYTEPVYVSGNLLVRARAYREGMEESPVGSFQVTVYTVATPVFTFENLKIKITCDTPDAIIRYTIDSTEPNGESEVYTLPIEPVEDIRIKAYASKEGLTDSPVNEFVFHRAEYTLPMPVISMNADSEVEISSSVDGVVIRYTTDGNDPDASSTPYEVPFKPVGNCVIKAYSTHANYYDSPVAEYAVTGYKVETPTCSFENPLLTLSTATEDAQIRYTLDGSVPGEDATLYSTPIRLTADCTVLARGFKANFEPSETVSFTYVYGEYQLPMPTASFSNRLLTLTCSDSEAQIRYTTDGSRPTHDSALYEDPLPLTEDCNVRFIAVREHYNDSDPGSYEFKVSDHQVARPVPAYDPETLQITLECTTDRAEIRYTVDGAVPTATTGEVYNDVPIPVDGNHTYTIRAFRSDLFDSEIVTLTINDQKVPTPTASFSNKLLTLTCQDTQAQIRYTTDGTLPTHDSALYGGSLPLTEDCTVRFIGVRENFIDSDPGSYEFKVSDHQVARPVPAYDPETLQITLECTTDRAEIRYTVDGAVPTATTGEVYNDAPIPVDGNHTYTIRAFRSDLFDSEVVTLTINDQKVPTPMASFSNKHLTLTCADRQARIRYTTDGIEPTHDSDLYVDPLPLTEDCTVRFIGVRENFIDSDPGSYEFKVSDHQVARPVPAYDPETLQITLECATEGAEIRYTIDGAAPTPTTGEVYNDTPIPVVGNHTYTIRAFRSDLFDSEIATEVVDDQKVPTPTHKYGAHHLTLVCSDELAQIRYTVDGNEPTETSTLYEAPIALSSDCTVRFIAIRQYFHNSEEEHYDFVLADHQETVPSIHKDFPNRLLTVEHPKSLSVKVRIGYIDTVEPTPWTIEVTPEMESISVTAIAEDEDLYDSEEYTEAIVFHMPPVLSYDGHAVYGTVAEGDPFAGEATMQFHFNGDICEGGTQDAPVEISEFGTVSAHVVSGSAFRSEPTTMEIDCFNTGSLAGVRNGHRLAEVFGSWDNGTTVYRSLDVCGELESEDLEFIATLPSLTALNLEPSLMTSEPCDGVFAGTRIETLSANALPQGILKGMPRLTTVVWTPADRKMPDGRLADAANPNILLWISDTENAPSDASNVVTYGSDETPTATNPSGVTGIAGSISLYDKYPYNAFMPVDAARVEFHKEFTQPTEIGVCQGWETMVIPFTATTIMHETRGEITPYLTWSGIDTDPKPFWLYRASGSGWEEAGVIEAGVPYIISMPNHPDYIYAFNLGGKVTFFAENVWLGTEESLPHPQDWQEGMVLEPIYMPVEGDMLSLNVNGESGLRTGSTFVPEAETLPFGCYISNAGTRMAVPVFDQWNGIIAPTVAVDDLTVDTPSPGTICISSGRDRKVVLCMPTGIVVATPALRAGEPVYIDNLAKGIYIAGGVKVMVK